MGESWPFFPHSPQPPRPAGRGGAQTAHLAACLKQCSAGCKWLCQFVGLRMKKVQRQRPRCHARPDPVSSAIWCTGLRIRSAMTNINSWHINNYCFHSISHEETSFRSVLNATRQPNRPSPAPTGRPACTSRLHTCGQIGCSSSPFARRGERGWGRVGESHQSLGVQVKPMYKLRGCWL